MDDLGLFSKCKNTYNLTNQDFVGIEYNENDVTVYFPLGYEIPQTDEECRKSILTLLRTISLSKTIINEEVKINDELKEDYAFPISAYLWVLKDYFTYGIYKSRDTIIQKNGNGKINWKKTLSKDPIISNGNLLYLDMFTEQNVAIDDIITQIHILCLNESIKHIGWLFGNFELKSSLFSLDNKEYLLGILNHALINTNEDRKLNLLINLRNILLGLDVVSDDKSINNYGVRGFHDVWEIVVARLFGNQDVTGYKPVASYKLFDSSNSVQKQPLRLDGLLKRPNAYYILDAKYYKFGIDFDYHSAPETSDVEKQIVYGEYVDKVHNKKYPVYNSFVIPYNKNNNPRISDYHDNIVYVGYSTVSWKCYDENVKPYYYVAIIMVDCRFALDNWVYNDSTEFINDIVSKIEMVKPLLIENGWILPSN